MNTYSHVFWNWFLARRRGWRWPFAIGAGLPDLIYVGLMALVLLEHRRLTWGDLSLWEAATRNPYTLALHSFVPVGLVLLLAHALGWSRLLPWLWGIATHVAIDMLTHVNDGYPILWPVSDVRFPAPISYWEAEHGGRVFFLVNHLLIACAIAWIALRRVRRRPATRRQSDPSRSSRGRAP